MKSATVSELRDHLSDWLRQVEAGERVRVLRRDDVIAMLVPPGSVDADDPIASRVDSLVRSGGLRRGTSDWPEWSRAAVPGRPVPILGALLADREEGR